MLEFSDPLACAFCGTNDSKSQDDKLKLLLFSFPDSRKNPVIYSRWCTILEIEPKKEKTSKPRICEKHFNKKDIQEAGTLKVGAVPKLTLLRLAKKPKVSTKTSNPKEIAPKKNSLKMRNKSGTEPLQDSQFGIKIKDEPFDQSFDEITIEETRFADQLQEDQLGNVLINDENQSDSDFIENLLSGMRQMSNKQKEVFRVEMMSLIIGNI